MCHQTFLRPSVHTHHCLNFFFSSADFVHCYPFNTRSLEYFLQTVNCQSFSNSFGLLYNCLLPNTAHWAAPCLRVRRHGVISVVWNGQITVCRQMASSGIFRDHAWSPGSVRMLHLKRHARMLGLQSMLKLYFLCFSICATCDCTEFFTSL